MTPEQVEGFMGQLDGAWPHLARSWEPGEGDQWRKLLAHQDWDRANVLLGDLVRGGMLNRPTAPKWAAEYRTKAGAEEAVSRTREAGERYHAPSPRAEGIALARRIVDEQRARVGLPPKNWEAA